ncbi:MULTISPECIES: F510_1955 family glycosylhydrolase [unclassified Streptomyces]|uniref:F510_1955 family glycosylhydrolase n=1 Tax=unclassified Streptomyces TaxID=2593676 RepID=UPI002365FB74|nr:MULTISPECIES: exo-alpha-sialidase [unclassified Streptomyces]MDF3142492.1 exo-alpha-sialidase [Streptomyces sp. T21Q-yed]WDF43915.1 exo-alpha-sialidase [Streptomyces sp. T12]
MKIRSRAATVITAAVLTAVLAACSSGSDASSDTASADGSGGLTVSHVHGLGIDPADGRLYVATHEGVIAVADDGAAQRVGDAADYMGFTVIGPKTFLGSGHPAEGSGDHGNRGLIQSTDSGRTWKTLSLGGTTDFHSLEYGHNTVYGYDSTRGLLRVSADRTTWDSRAQFAALDIAVSPKDRDLVLATTEDGVAASTDGGRTFGTVSGQVLAFLSWPEADALYGVDLGGGLQHSTDGGTTWRKTGTVPGGQPQALTAVDAEHLLAATQDGVYESRDGGRTFTRRLPVSSAEGH